MCMHTYGLFEYEIYVVNAQILSKNKGYIVF